MGGSSLRPDPTCPEQDTVASGDTLWSWKLPQVPLSKTFGSGVTLWMRKHLLQRIRCIWPDRKHSCIPPVSEGLGWCPSSGCGSSHLPVHSPGDSKMAQELGFLSLLWETWVVLLAPDFTSGPVLALVNTWESVGLFCSLCLKLKRMRIRGEAVSSQTLRKAL